MWAPLQIDKDWNKSLFHPPTRSLDPEEHKEIKGLVLEQAITNNIDNSCYLFNGVIRKGDSGLATGGTSSGPWLET